MSALLLDPSDVSDTHVNLEALHDAMQDALDMVAGDEYESQEFLDMGHRLANMLDIVIESDNVSSEFHTRNVSQTIIDRCYGFIKAAEAGPDVANVIMDDAKQCSQTHVDEIQELLEHGMWKTHEAIAKAFPKDLEQRVDFDEMTTPLIYIQDPEVSADIQHYRQLYTDLDALHATIGQHVETMQTPLPQQHIDAAWDLIEVSREDLRRRRALRRMKRRQRRAQRKKGAAGKRRLRRERRAMRKRDRRTRYEQRRQNAQAKRQQRQAQRRVKRQERQRERKGKRVVRKADRKARKQQRKGVRKERRTVRRTERRRDRGIRRDRKRVKRGERRDARRKARQTRREARRQARGENRQAKRALRKRERKNRSVYRAEDRQQRRQDRAERPRYTPYVPAQPVQPPPPAYAPAPTPAYAPAPAPAYAPDDTNQPSFRRYEDENEESWDLTNDNNDLDASAEDMTKGSTDWTNEQELALQRERTAILTRRKQGVYLQGDDTRLDELDEAARNKRQHAKEGDTDFNYGAWHF